MNAVDNNQRPEQAIDEVELTTEDLLGMTPAHVDATPSTAVAAEVRHEHVDARASEPAIVSQRKRSIPLFAVALSVPIAAAALVVGAQYTSSIEPPKMETRHGALAEIQQAPPAIEQTQPPVRFTNPFDATEVFEFPAGTTQEQARAAVAELLLQRANERRHLLEGRR